MKADCTCHCARGYSVVARFRLQISFLRGMQPVFDFVKIAFIFNYRATDRQSFGTSSIA